MNLSAVFSFTDSITAAATYDLSSMAASQITELRGCGARKPCRFFDLLLRLPPQSLNLFQQRALTLLGCQSRIPLSQSRISLSQSRIALS